MQHKGILLLLVAVLGLIIASCAYGPKRVTFNALSGAEITVDTAMQAWGDYVGQFHPPATQEQAVQDAYKKYQAAEASAIDAAVLVIELTGAGSTNAIPDAQAKANAAAANSAQAFADLLQLLRQFGVKI